MRYLDYLGRVISKFPVFFILRVKDKYYGALLTKSLSQYKTFALPVPFFPPIPAYRHELCVICGNEALRRIESSSRAVS